MGLDFVGFTVADPSTLTARALKPHSPPNLAVPSPDSAATITRDFDENSHILAFDLQSLYGGCDLILLGSSTHPINCTLTFTGLRSELYGGGLVTDTFDFGVGTASGMKSGSVPVAYHELPDSFNHLSEVNIKVSTDVDFGGRLPISGANYATDDVEYRVTLDDVQEGFAQASLFDMHDL